MKKTLTIAAAAALLLAGCSTTDNDKKVNIKKQTIQLKSDQMTPEALWAMTRLSACQASPDAQHIAFQTGYYSVEENASHQVLWMMNADGSEQRQFTTDADTETEENWFSNWEYDGAYWEKAQTARARRTYENSPHRFVDKWDTPILCIHGEKDYRINATQGMSAFNAARMRGIEAELLLFPDENHWVLKPQNGILWQRTYFDWLARWLK